MYRFYSSGGGTVTINKAALTKLFDQYREASADTDILGADDTMKYLQDIDVDLEGLESLAALEIVQAPTMGEIARDGFVNGWQERR